MMVQFDVNILSNTFKDIFSWSLALELVPGAVSHSECDFALRKYLFLHHRFDFFFCLW